METRDVLSLLLFFASLAAVLGSLTAAFGCAAHPPRVTNTITLVSPSSLQVGLRKGNGTQDVPSLCAYAQTPSFSARIEVGLHGPESRAPACTFSCADCTFLHSVLLLLFRLVCH